MDINELHSALANLAATTPDEPGLLTAIHRDARRSHRRRATLVGGSALVVTGAAVAVAAGGFPATGHPGSCLGVLLEYVPTCDSAACCELVIESDDPDLPQRTVLVTGCLRRTLWSALRCWAAQELHEILEAGNC